MEPSWTRYQNRVPCIGRWIPSHWTAREVLNFLEMVFWVLKITTFRAIVDLKD